MMQQRAMLQFSVVAACFCVLVAATPDQAPPAADADTFLERAYDLYDKCAQDDLFVCLKERAVRFIENLPGDYEVAEGVTLLRSEAAAESSRAFPQESIDKLPTAEREQAVDNLLVDRVAKFLGSHTLQFKIPESAIGEMQRSLEESRKKKKKLLLPILLLLKLKAATLIPIALGALTLLAFKALIVGKIALLISGIIALKKLLKTDPHSQTYEVVAHPHHTYSSTYSDDHGHYGRSMPAESQSAEPQNLAYNAHVPRA